MGKVLAKFRLNSYTTEIWTQGYEKDGEGKPDYNKPIKVEKRTLNFTPVQMNPANPEDKTFWDATPTGSLQMGVVNQEAWKEFELDQSYFLTFTRAE